MSRKTIATDMHILLMRFAFALAAVFVISILLKDFVFDDSKIKVGILLPGDVNERGWNNENYKGVSAACKANGLELLYKDNVPEFSGSVELAVDWLVNAGAKTVFLSSYNYSKSLENYIKDHPDIEFFDVSSKLHLKNVTPYFVRVYQARYLSGIIAGMKTVTSRIGYIAAIDNQENNRSIAAFTMGVKSVNPNATVYVMYVNSWNDEAIAKAYAKNLITSKRVDVITCQQNQSEAIEKTTSEFGIYFIGFLYMVDGASDHMLTSVKVNWAPLYKEILDAVKKGSVHDKERYTLGYSDGVVGLAPFSAKVDTAIINRLRRAEKRFEDGRDIFEGNIYDYHKNLVVSDRKPISDVDLFENFNWLPLGVEILR